jgi:hypothetical protein
VEQQRPSLSELLQRVKDQPGDHEARLQAARQALLLAFHKGDPHFADIAESLLVDAPRRLPAEAREALQHLAAQAHAIRRAVAIAHQEAYTAPSSLLRSLSSDPEALVSEITALQSEGRWQVARAMLEVSLARHPGHLGLRVLQDLLLDPWTEEVTAP